MIFKELKQIMNSKINLKINLKSFAFLMIVLTGSVLYSFEGHAAKKKQKEAALSKYELARFMGVSCPNTLVVKPSDVAPNFIEPQPTEDFPSPHFYESDEGTNSRGFGDF